MNFKTFSSKALMAWALSATMLTACYDDSDVTNRLSSLEESVEALQAMKSDIEALQAMLSGQTTIASVTEADGVYTITLSDNTTFTVVGGQAGVVTLVEIDGAYYWATMGANGQKTPITDANGNNLPLLQTPGIRISDVTGEWEVLSNGTWVSTGVSAEQSAVITDVTDDEAYAYFTLADGTVVKVAKASEMVCAIESGKLYFDASQTKTVPATVKGGKYIITKPEGWKAALTDKGLRITAPAETNADAELTGTVAIMLVGANGMSMIAEVGVEMGKPSVSLSVDGGMVSVKLNTAWKMYFEVVPASEFDINAAFAKASSAAYEYEDVEADFASLIPNMVAGKLYVLWAIDGNEQSAADIQYITFFPKPAIEIGYVAEKSNFENLYLTIESKGYDAYYLGFTQKAYFDDTYLIEDAQSGFLDKYTKVSFAGMYTELFAYGEGIMPATEYVFYAIPAVAGVTAADIVKLDITSPAVSFGGTGEVSVTIGEATITSVSATIAPAAGVYKAFYRYYSAAALAEFATDELLLADLVKYGSDTEAEKAYTKSGLSPDTKGFIVAVAVSADSKAGQLVKVAADTKAIAYNKDIKVDGVVTPGTSGASVALTFTGNVVKFRTMLMTYSQFGTSWNYGGNDAKVKEAMATQEVWTYGYNFTDYNAADYASAPLELSGLTSSTDYVLFIGAYDAEGNLSDVVTKFEFTTKSLSYVRKTDARWEASKPTVTIVSTDGTGAYFDMEYKVTPGEGCVKYYACAVSYYDEYTWAEKVQALLEEAPETTEQTFTAYASKFTVIYVVWEDADGNVYEAYELPVEGNV